MNLLMLTKFYPYGTGEAFIENEIQIFSEYFDKIFIIACEVPGNEDRIRELPNNVKAFRVNAGRKSTDILKGIINNAFSNQKEFKRELEYCKGIKRKAFLYYFEEKSQRIYKEILRNKYLEDVVSKSFMLYSYWLFTTARVGTLIGQKYKPTLMFTRTHRYDLYEDRNAINYLPYRSYLLNEFNKIFPCSDNGTIYLQKKYPEYSEKIRTAFLGTLDHGTGKYSNDGVFRIVSCSRVVPEKRVEKIVDALNLIDIKGLKVEWHHIGDGAGLEKIKSLCKHLKNIKCVFYGNIPNEEVLKHYEENPYDLFVNVSNSEGLPVSIMESISFGMPVIATDVGGNSEIVLTGITGQLLDEDFKDITLAEEIIKFIEMDRYEYQGYRERCRAKWQESFQAIPNYRKICELLMDR